ncbi:beta-1,4-endoxylanase [Mycena olivaceomarginata]|nr:beta-1,4-endoxylanase [Mycena olivaceomarginata]
MLKISASLATVLAACSCAGSVCTFQNDFYSQCLPDGTATTTTGGSRTTAALPTGTSTVKSNTVAKSPGKKLYFGSTTDNPELTDADVATLSDNTLFGQLTPGNSMKWDATEPSRGKLCFMFGKKFLGDTIAALAKKNGQLLRGHNWVSSGGFNATTLPSILRWLSTMQARFINDSAGSKATAMINLVKSLKAAGTPIDGIGIQGHLIVGQVPSKAALIANYQAFTALGLDIRMVLPETPALLAQQQTDYNTVVSACKAVAGCVGVTIWYFWIPGVFSGQGAALPWDNNLIRKPAYDGIIAGFTN